MEHDSILIRNGWIVTMNPEREILRGNLYLENGRIKELPSVRQTADIVIDADGMLVLPGFVISEQMKHAVCNQKGKLSFFAVSVF